MNKPHRNTICVEDAIVADHTPHPDEQFVLRLTAPKVAARAVPGGFVHVQCASDIPMRRPLSIMRVDADAGWVEVLYKIIGPGLRALAQVQTGDTVSVIGPIGNGFSADPQRKTAVLIGGGVGIPPLVFLAERIAAGDWPDARAVAFFGSELPFPFELVVSEYPLDGIPDKTNRSIELLENIHVPCRLATNAGYDGCYDGYVTDLARQWLSELTNEQRDQVMIYSCGPEPMLEAVSKLANQFDLPSQLCLEEFMACAVGGCAGCAVEVTTPDGVAMKRVCVDGPVFSGASIYAG